MKSMKALIVLAHPNIETSRVNKRWREKLAQHTDIAEIHELYREYPDWQIDVEREQHLLESHELIVLQFPFYWYSYPPLLKKWLDDVFTYGWAYGSAGRKLVGKKFGIAVSIGDKEENYTRTGNIGFTVDEVLTPFKATAGHVGATPLPYFALFGASFQATDEDIAQSANAYIEYVRHWKATDVSVVQI
jgi:nad(p)h dehydrogenase, quinone 2 like protein